MFFDLTNITIPFAEYKFDEDSLPDCIERMKQVMPRFAPIGVRLDGEEYEHSRLFLLNKETDSLTFLAVDLIDTHIPYVFVLANDGDRCLQPMEVVRLISNIVERRGQTHITNIYVDPKQIKEFGTSVYSDIANMCREEISCGHFISIEQVVEWGNMILKAIYDVEAQPDEIELRILIRDLQTWQNDYECQHPWER